MSVDKMLVPMPWTGEPQQLPVFLGYDWLKNMPDNKIYLDLFLRWPIKNLPSGYDFYIVSFHLEAVDINWLRRQKVSGPIIVLFDGNHYNLDIPGVVWIPFYYWHIQLKNMQDWFGQQQKTKPKYKFSAVCNRITQSKAWITTKLLESALESSLVVLNSWIEEKNVHGWLPTSNSVLDDLMTIFRKKYMGQQIKIDDFNNATQNFQHITGNPWQPLYQDCVINFTNESFHYSGMMENNMDYIWPGPFLTEKTFKCLLGGTAFVPVGQFQTYETLEKLGFCFNYEFDTSWDLDPGNLTRCASIVNLIDCLNQFDIDELHTFTQPCNDYNQNHVISGSFFKICEQKNQESIEQIYRIMV